MVDKRQLAPKNRPKLDSPTRPHFLSVDPGKEAESEEMRDSYVFYPGLDSVTPGNNYTNYLVQ